MNGVHAALMHKVRSERMMPARFLLAVPLLMICSTAFAADAAPAEPTKMTTLIVYGDDPCPRSSDDEIVVCAREPEGERYRIPKRLRRVNPKAADRSWGDRAQVLEMVSTRGTPNSCSPIGSNGQTGCMSQFLRQAREEREQSALEGRQVP
jgi:hypothetical protein